MNKRLIILGLLSLPVFALASLPRDPTPEDRLRTLVAKHLAGPDVRVEVERVDDGFCGKEGPTYYAHVDVRRPKKVLNEDTGETEVKNNYFEHVVSYYISGREIRSRDADVKAVGACAVPSDRTIDLRGGAPRSE